MPAYLRLITDAAERDTDELPPHRTGNRRSERRLADTGCTDEAEDGGILLRCQLTHGKIVEDALLDLFESVVIAFEHSARSIHIDRLFGRVHPRQFDQTVQIAADHTDLGTHRRADVEAVNLTLDGLAYSIGVRPLRESRAITIHIGGLIRIVAELLMDCLDLFTQIKIALNLVHLLTYTTVDLLLDPHDVQLIDEHLIETMQACAHINGGKDILPHLMLQAQMARDNIRQTPHVLHDRDRHQRLGRNLMRELHPLLKFARNTVNECLHILCGGRFHTLLVNHMDIRLRVRLPLADLHDLRALLSIHQDPQHALGQAQKLTDLRNCTDIIEVCRRRVIQFRILL